MKRYRLAPTVLAAIVLALAAPRATQAVAVAWYVAPTGDDAADCLSVSTPCQTIAGAVGKAVAGGVVLVAEGTYTAAAGTEVVLLDKSVALSGGWDAAFATQGGMSVIDGGGVRRGLTVPNGVVASVERFTIRNGFNGIVGGGVSVASGATLTLESCSVVDNVATPWGAGIDNYGTLTVNRSTISNNTGGEVGFSGGSGGAGIRTSGALTISDSTVSGNTLLGSFSGAGIDATGTLSVANCTISGNTGGEGIAGFVATMTLDNATISGNGGAGLANVAGSATLRNTIVAGNGDGDCQGAVSSGGYNLIGNGDGCGLVTADGDQVGSAVAPLDPRLAPLAANGGSTLTRALLAGSPAIDAGNPAAPGSGGGACLAADQRGTARPVASACDIGAFEGSVPGVVSIVRAGVNPTSAASVDFTVTFSDAVTGVDTAAPFADFAVTAGGSTAGTVAAVSGSGATYTVTVAVRTRLGNGTIRLDVVDDDSILDSLSQPLGGAGAGNGGFTAGERYGIRTIPTPKAPVGKVALTRPTYRWSRIPGATQYRYQVFKGLTPVSTRTVPAAACGANTCTDIPPVPLAMAPYRWRVQALVNGAWHKFSAYKGFTIGPRAGFWEGYAIEFYVTPDLAYVDNYAIYIYVTGCGPYKVTYTTPVRILDGRFAVTGDMYFNGSFSTVTSASGTLGLEMLYIPGCGFVSGGPYAWDGIWQSPNQPYAAEVVAPGGLAIAPALGGAGGAFTVEAVE